MDLYSNLIEKCLQPISTYAMIIYKSITSNNKLNLRSYNNENKFKQT